MLEQVLGHRPRVTAYFGGLGAGLSLVAAGIEAVRLNVAGPVGQSAVTAYAAVGLLFGLVLAFVAAYVNGSLVSGWLVGAVPAAGRVGGLALQGADPRLATAISGTAGVGLVLGGVGYGLAAEKLRRDTVGADLVTAVPRVTSTALAAASIGFGLGSLVVFTTL